MIKNWSCKICEPDQPVCLKELAHKSDSFTDRTDPVVWSTVKHSQWYGDNGSEVNSTLEEMIMSESFYISVCSGL